MNAFEFGVGRVARGDPVREQAGRLERGRDRGDAVRRFRVRDAAEMFLVQIVVHDDH
jgi:hypothetical protein